MDYTALTAGDVVTISRGKDLLTGTVTRTTATQVLVRMGGNQHETRFFKKDGYRVGTSTQTPWHPVYRIVSA